MRLLRLQQQQQQRLPAAGGHCSGRSCPAGELPSVDCFALLCVLRHCPCRGCCKHMAHATYITLRCLAPTPQRADSLLVETPAGGCVAGLCAGAAVRPQPPVKAQRALPLVASLHMLAQEAPLHTPCVHARVQRLYVLPSCWASCLFPAAPADSHCHPERRSHHPPIHPSRCTTPPIHNHSTHKATPTVPLTMPLTPSRASPLQGVEPHHTAAAVSMQQAFSCAEAAWTVAADMCATALHTSRSRCCDQGAHVLECCARGQLPSGVAAQHSPVTAPHSRPIAVLWW
jgi:hypothetical protein